MNMRQLIDKYIEYRQSLGEKFASNGRILRAYGRFVGESSKATLATTKQIKQFVDGDGPVTNSRRKRYDALKGLYLYAHSRGFIASNPMPTEVPKWEASLGPHIDFKAITGTTDSHSVACNFISVRRWVLWRCNPIRLVTIGLRDPYLA